MQRSGPVPRVRRRRSATLGLLSAQPCSELVHLEFRLFRTLTLTPSGHALLSARHCRDLICRVTGLELSGLMGCPCSQRPPSIYECRAREAAVTQCRTTEGQ